MERISGLPELTPEEIAAQKEKQYAPLGEAIAAKFLAGLFSDNELPMGLDKYEADQKAIVRRALLAGLCRAIQLEGGLESAARALHGMSRIAPAASSLIDKAAGDFQSVVREYEQAKQDSSSGFAAEWSRKMADLGISGSAVRPNLNENEDWQEELGKLRQPYESKLEALRARLLQEIQDCQFLPSRFGLPGEATSSAPDHERL
jgi:hypothetical protein